MKTNHTIKVGTTPANVIRGLLLTMDITLRDVARELGVTPTTVHLVIKGKGTSSRVSAYIEEKLRGASVK